MHMDASVAGQPLRASLCGWLGVPTAGDITEVTCAKCLSRFRRKAPRGPTAALSDADIRQALVMAFSATLAPTAGPPPVLTPETWATACRDVHRRCGECTLCAWERDVAMWAHVAPYNKIMRLDKPAGAARWPSLAAALVALIEWERHGRVAPSASAGILACIERGYMEGGSNKSGDPLLNRGGELVRVRMALEQACPQGAHPLLTQAQCIAVVMARTPGVLLLEEPYDQISAWCGVSVGSLQALVKNGRRSLTVELAARGLIPKPRPDAGLAEAIESALCGMERQVANG